MNMRWRSISVFACVCARAPVFIVTIIIVLLKIIFLLLYRAERDFGEIFHVMKQEADYFFLVSDAASGSVPTALVT